MNIPLGELKTELLLIGAGAKLAYVVDAAFHADNAARIVALARGADQLFIEAAFLEADAAVAARTRHLTAAQAGALAREADVKHVVPFHFSRRYLGHEELPRHELAAIFTGEASRMSEC